MESSTEHFAPRKTSKSHGSASLPFQHPGMGADIFYYDYGEVDYEYKDYAPGDGAHMDSDLIVRSDGTIQKISSLDLSKADIFNISETWEYNSSLNDSDYSDFPGNASLSTARTVAAIFFSLFFLVGLLGNILVIYTVWRFPSMRRVTYFFLVNLAVTNLIYLLLGLPTITVSYLKMDWPFGDHFCKIDNYVMSVSMSVSILTIMATGFDRYLAVVYPLRSRRVRTRTVSVVVICTTWVLSLVLMIPRGLLYATQPWLHDSYIPSTLCTRVASSYRLRLDTGLRFGLLYLLPLAVLIACHLRIGWTLRTRTRSRCPGAQPQQQRPIVRTRQSALHGGDGGIEETDRAAEEDLEAGIGRGRACPSHALFCRPLCTNEGSLGPADDAGGTESFFRPRQGFQPTGQTNASTVTAIKIVFALTAVFALGWLPLHLHYLAIDFGLMDSVFLPQFLNGGTVALLFCFGANALNPILYCIFSSHFRRHFRKALDQWCCSLFKTNVTHSTVMDIDLRSHVASDRGGVRTRQIGACGRPLLFGKAKHFLENIEEGEGLNADDTIVRRMPVLQPRPASLLCEDMDTIDLLQYPPCQPLATLPGECLDTQPAAGHDGGQTSEYELTSVTRGAQHLLANTSQLDSPCQLSDNYSSSLELQRHQDISPISVEKITQIELSPARESTLTQGATTLSHTSSYSNTSKMASEKKVFDPTRQTSSSHAHAPEPVDVWAWPSSLDDGVQKLSVATKSQAVLALKPPSHENLESDSSGNPHCQRHSSSSEGLDTTSSSSGISTLHSSDSRTRLSVTSVNVTGKLQDHSPIHFDSIPASAKTPCPKQSESTRAKLFSNPLPRLTVHSIFSQPSPKARNPSSREHFYSKDCCTSTTDLNSVCPQPHTDEMHYHGDKSPTELRPTFQNNLDPSSTVPFYSTSHSAAYQKLLSLPRQGLTNVEYLVESEAVSVQPRSHKHQKISRLQNFDDISSPDHKESAKKQGVHSKNSPNIPNPNMKHSLISQTNKSNVGTSRGQGSSLSSSASDKRSHRKPNTPELPPIG